MWAEPQPTRSYSGGTSANRLPSSPTGVISDSNDSILQHRQAAAAAATLSYNDNGALSPEALDLQQMQESACNELDHAESLHHRMDVAAVQDSLAHMSMPHLSPDLGAATPAQLKPPGRRQPPGSPGGCLLIYLKKLCCLIHRLGQHKAYPA